MQNVRKCFQVIIEKCTRWYYHSILSEATKAEIEEWYEEQRRLRTEEEAMEAKWLAEYIQQGNETEVENDVRKQGVDILENSDSSYERSMTEYEEDRSQEDRSHCPLCGTPWAYYGRCKPCDRAFGRD